MMYHKNPLHMILFLIVHIVALVGIWNHDWTLIIVAAAIMIIKKVLFCGCCCKEEAKPARKARPRRARKRR